MVEDAELLKRFATEGSEEAFAELVRRRIDLVYSVALRRVAGDVHLAQDVTQQVFVDLARKARELARHPVISGWLFRSTQFAASRAVRAEQRRRAREKEAERMKLNQPETEADLERLRPLLDDAMTKLAEVERDVVALRFFEARSLAEIGRVLRVTEDAARKRVERALEKLHGALVERGIGSTVAALSGALAMNVANAAPIGLAAAATSAAVSTSGGSAGVATFLTMSKLQSGIAAAVVLAGTMVVGIDLHEQQRLQAVIAASASGRPNVAVHRAENVRLEAQATEAMALRRQEAELAGLRKEITALIGQRNADQTARTSTAPRVNAMVPAAETVAGLDRMPQARFRTPPTYPLALRQAGLGGDVLVEFTVDAKGGMTDVHVIKSTRAEFEQAAVDAVKAWEFRPGAKNERQISTRMLVPMVFRMENDPYDPVPLTIGSANQVLLDPFHVSASVPKPGESLPSPARTWF